MKVSRIALFFALSFLVSLLIGCSEPTRQIDPSKMTDTEKAVRQEKAGE
ncbi:MAG: hypothetical protein SFU56_19330 [Capsulimonadales bacterium]|nr:hypothetical protein [Capsulimonadales bacterium]